MPPRKKKQKAKNPLLRRVRIAIGRIRQQQILTFLAFVAISLAFWLIITAREESDRTYTVSLRIADQPQQAVFTTYVPSQLRVTVRDKNVALFKAGYGQRLEVLTVDFSRYADASGNFRISGAELQSLLVGALESSTQITSVQPNLVDARYAITDGRMVAVRLDADLIAADDCQLRPATIRPDSVLIHAPSAMLDTITGINTQRIRHFAVDDTLRQTLALALPIGAKAEPAQVEVTVPVAHFVAKELSAIPIRTVGTPRGRRLEVFPDKARLTCLVDFDAYRQLTAESIDLTVAYDDLTDPEQRRLPVRVSISRPAADALTHITLTPDSVDFLIVDVE